MGPYFWGCANPNSIRTCGNRVLVMDVNFGGWFCGNRVSHQSAKETRRNERNRSRKTISRSNSILFHFVRCPPIISSQHRTLLYLPTSDPSDVSFHHRKIWGAGGAICVRAICTPICVTLDPFVWHWTPQCWGAAPPDLLYLPIIRPSNDDLHHTNLGTQGSQFVWEPFASHFVCH